MVTEAQLKSEPEWGAQYVAPKMREFVGRLEAYYDANQINIGAYGDIRHLKGYHRSRRWIRESRYCTNHRYSISETAGNRNGGDDNAISGVDIVVGQAQSRIIWARVHSAKQRGRLSYVRELLLERSPWHVHLGIDRAWSNADLTELFLIITGQDDPREGLVNLSLDMPVLQNGSEGAHVLTAQSLLCARGMQTQLDGEFGAHTEAQTRLMQQTYGAEAIDGIWGPETWTIAITGEDRV